MLHQVDFENCCNYAFLKIRLLNLLIKTENGQIAAPSAKHFWQDLVLQEHLNVEYDLKGKIDMIIDGGSCEFGLESTIVDVSGDVPCLLRPGSITLGCLEMFLGE